MLGAMRLFIESNHANRVKLPFPDSDGFPVETEPPSCQAHVVLVKPHPVDHFQLLFGFGCEICPCRPVGQTDCSRQDTSVYCHTPTISSFHRFSSPRWMVSYEPAHFILFFSRKRQNKLKIYVEYLHSRKFYNCSTRSES